MSDTPRTEAAYDAADDSKLYALSQQLERDHNAALELLAKTGILLERRDKELTILRAAQSIQYTPPPDNRWMRLAHRLATQLYAKPEDTKTTEDRIVLDMYSQLAGEAPTP